MRAYKFKKLKRIHGVYFTPDGGRLVAVGGAEVRMVDSAVWLDLASGENVGRFDQFALCHAVTPDLGRVAFGGASNWRGGFASVQWVTGPPPAGWERFAWPKRNLPPSYRNVSGLAFDPTGARLALTHTQPSRRGGVMYAWRLTLADRDTGEAHAVLPCDFEAAVMSFRADGARLAATGGMDGDTRVAVFDVAAKRELFRFAPPATVTRCARFLPDGRLAVANGRNVYVLPADGGDPQLTLSGHPKQVNAVAVAPDGRLLTASHDGSIRVWDAHTGAPGPSFDWAIGPVTALAFSPDGLTCAAAGLNGNVVVWDAGG